MRLLIVIALTLIAYTARAENAGRKLRLIAVHPTYYYDVREAPQADVPLRKLVAEFQAQGRPVMSLVEPDVDLAAKSCADPRYCGLKYSSYLPGIEKTQIVESSQGENQIVIPAGETVVLAGGYFELCFQKAFLDLIRNARGNEVQIVFFLPAIYFGNPPRSYNLYTKIEDMIREHMSDRDYLDLEVKLRFGMRERTLGRGSKRVTVRVVNDLSKI